MAILEDAPGIEVTVQIAGKDAPEYEAGDEKSKPLDKPPHPTVTKYIESIDDAEFAVKIVASSEHAWGYKGHVLVCRVYIDGNHIISKFTYESGEIALNSMEAFCTKSQQWKSSKLKFSAVSITEESHPESLMQDAEAVKNLGLIKVVVERHIKTGHPYVCCEKPLANNKKLKFSAKLMKGKAISHGTTRVNLIPFSSSKPIQTPKHRQSKRLPEDNGPIAVFQFLYRSKDALQQTLVIPRSPLSPSPPPSSSKAFGELSPVEIERLARERFEQIQGGEALKKEAEPSKRRLKSEDLTEEDANPRKTKRRAQFIDLTLD
ncbi:hypothetical protein F5Y03DRAFT_406962 [Xylaria venustula]|nr:hypothetical protein F5Y03DRAFT_406962 [Xylaria venustula]